MENSSTTSPPLALPWTGHCACNHIRYSLSATPLVIHFCHCHQCQIETGSIGAVNLIIESSNVSSVSRSLYPSIYSIEPNVVHASLRQLVNPSPQSRSRLRYPLQSTHPFRFRQRPTHRSLPQMLRCLVFALRRQWTLHVLYPPRHTRY